MKYCQETWINTIDLFLECSRRLSFKFLELKAVVTDTQVSYGTDNHTTDNADRFTELVLLVLPEIQRLYPNWLTFEGESAYQSGLKGSHDEL